MLGLKLLGKMYSPLLVAQLIMLFPSLNGAMQEHAPALTTLELLLIVVKKYFPSLCSTGKSIAKQTTTLT